MKSFVGRASLVLGGALLAAAVPASAEILFQDDFNDDPGTGFTDPLLGNTAVSGQAWEHGVSWLTGEPDTGAYVNHRVGGNGNPWIFGASKGAGNDESTFRGNGVQISPTHLTTGVITVSYDAVRSPQNGGGGAVYNAYQGLRLFTDAEGASVGQDWGTGPNTHLEAGGMGTGNGFNSGATNLDGGSWWYGVMHQTFSIDLDHKTAHSSWYDTLNPGNTNRQGTLDGSYLGTFTPNYLQFWAQSGIDSVDNWVGYDNIVVTYEAPSTASAWNFNGNGDWTVASNWLGGVPNAAGATANFGTIITSAATVNVDAPQTVGKINFDNINASYTIGGSNTLTLSDSSGPSITDTNGSHTISAPVSLAGNTTVTVAGLADTLTISGQVSAGSGVSLTKAGPGTLAMKNVRADSLVINGGSVKVLATATANDPASTSVIKGLSVTGTTLDLGNNSLVLDYTGSSPLDGVRQYIGAGTISTSASSPAGAALGYAEASALGLSSFAGQSVDADAVLIKFTYQGDTNLDGQVDVIDLGNLATGWQTNGTWVNGDSNYDGFIDVIDLGLLATNWQAGVGSPLGPGSLDEALAAYGLPNVAVPEPAGLSLAALAGYGLVRRVRRRW